VACVLNLILPSEAPEEVEEVEADGGVSLESQEDKKA